VIKYITGIIQKREHKLIAINSMPDHIHILIGYNPKMALADLVRDIKKNSSNFINEKKWLKAKFYWQEGYGAFSYSRSQLDKVIKYIENQEEHHKRKDYRQEYLEMLEKFGVEYDLQYVFDKE
jgi:REP element-mobilizing transposase RayT